MASLTESQLRNRFAEDFSAAARDLLEGRPGGDTSPDAELDFGPAGMVVFFGDCIRGAFLIAQRHLSYSDAERCSQLRSEDWLGEMANQLAGRVKSSLTRVGLDFVIVPPLCLHGAQLSAATAAADCWSALTTSDGQFHAWALLNIVGPIPPLPGPDAEAVLQEGEILLF